MRNARIIVYPEVEAFGGEERVLLGFSRYLHENGLDHRIVCYRDHIGLGSYADWPIAIDEILPMPAGAFSKARALKRHLASLAPSAPVPILFGLQAAAHAAIGGLTNYYARIADPPSFLEDGGALPLSRRLPGALRRKLFYRLAGFGLRRARGVVTNAHYLADELKACYGVEAHVIYVGGKPPAGDAFPGPGERRGGPLHILSISRLEWNKRIDWLIDAFAGLPEAVPEAARGELRLDIAGTGSLRPELEARVAALGLGSEVTFHGFVSDEKVEALYRQAAVFAMPAIQGFGLPALEALYRKVPVVMHRQSGVSEVLGGVGAVEVFDGETEALRQALARMVGRIRQGDVDMTELPALPTEQSFAEQLSVHCGWAAGT